jgi:hypothetical protein
MKWKSRLATSLAAVALICMAFVNARAATVTFSLTGTANGNDLQGLFGGGSLVDAPFSASFVLDTSQGTMPGPDHYIGGTGFFAPFGSIPLTGSVTIGGHTFDAFTSMPDSLGEAFPVPGDNHPFLIVKTQDVACSGLCFRQLEFDIFATDGSPILTTPLAFGLSTAIVGDGAFIARNTLADLETILLHATAGTAAISDVPLPGALPMMLPVVLGLYFGLRRRSRPGRMDAVLNHPA